VSRDAVVVAHGGVSRALRGLVLRDMPRAEVPILPVPQDKILVIAGERVRWL
jgi:broad specificity phosphatase PhoE